MMNRFMPGVIAAAGLATAALTNGCSSDNPISNAQSAVCCTEFQPGADMATAFVHLSGDAQFNGQFTAFAQAAGDMGSVAGEAMASVTSACRQIALDLGADPNDAAANGKAGKDLLQFWCGQATTTINASASASVQGSISLEYEAPQCQVSLQAQASCQGSCDVSGKCDIKANPPTCTGGKLEIACKGGCTGSATAPQIDCTGTCSGNCTGSCEAKGGVAIDCTGTCEGTCSAGTGAGNTGVQADGSCKGKCDGKCTISATAPKATCQGTCTGQCDAKCTAAPGAASVKCSGTCDADYEPLSCTGGTLEGGCKVDAKCQANCNASASAKASCTPPKLSVVANVKAGAEGQFAALRATLEANIPQLLIVVKARGDAFKTQLLGTLDGGASIVASGKLDLHGTSCLAAITAEATTASGNFGVTLDSAISVVGAAGGGK